MNELIINVASTNDLTEIIHLENAVWNENQRCSPYCFKQRLKNFREGFLIARFNQKIVASFYAIRRSPKLGESINWLHDSGNGRGSTHDENGTSLFSISITVSPNAPKGTYRKMMEAWRELAKQLNVSHIYAGSRIPGLKYFPGSPEFYLSKIKTHELFDPILSKAINCGFSVGNLIPNYFHDPDSLNYGVEIFQEIKKIENAL